MSSAAPTKAPKARDTDTLDEKLRLWLVDELQHRVLPMHWLQPLQQLCSWALDYRDGRALHDLITRYPRKQAKP
jgi:hypothetical protein